MARALKQKTEALGGGAARVAARRRDAWKGKETPSRGVDAKRSSSTKKGGKSARSSSSGVRRLLKLALLVGAMVCIGFFAILVVDVSAKLVGRVKLGEVTVVDLVHKMIDRVLDRDVPKPVVETPRAPKQRLAAPSPSPSTPPTTRAPLPATRPEEDARHVEHADARPDPEVQQAKERLDELFKRMPH